MQIIGITGPIGHGKTSFGQALQKLESNATHYESRDIISKLALAWLASEKTLPPPNDLTAINVWLKNLAPLLKQQLAIDCRFEQLEIQSIEVKLHPADYQKLFDYLARPQTDFSEANKALYRPLLQWVGGYCVNKLDRGIWFNEIVRRIKQDQAKGIDLVTVGGLRFPQEATILKAAGAVIVGIHRPDHVATDLTDPTERERQNIKVDTVVINNGSLDNLGECASQLYSDIKQNKLKAKYQSI